MNRYYCFISLLCILNVSTIFSDESICGKKAEMPSINLEYKEFRKQFNIYHEWQACVGYEGNVKNGVWIPETIWGPPEVIKLSKKRRLKLKGLDVKIKNIPQDWIVYRLRYPRDRYPLDRIECPDKLYNFAIGNRPIIKLSCGEPIPYNGETESDLEKGKGIKNRTELSGDLGPKDGKYIREVFDWYAQSYKKNKFTCNTICRATVDLEYKDWFLKNVYFRLE